MLRCAALLAACILVAGCADPTPVPGEAAPGPGPRLGFDPAELDRSVRPQDNFFRYVNGRWLAQTPIPADWASYGVTEMLVEQNDQQLRELVEETLGGGDDPDTARIAALYRSFMDTERLERLGLAPLETELTRIDRLSGTPALIAYFSEALSLGIQVPLTYYIEPDGDDTTRYLVYLWQDGLGLPDRDYYLLDTPALADARAAYVRHIERLFELAGWPDGPGAAQRIVALEGQLAEHQWSAVQNRDDEAIYRSKFDLRTAEALAPGFDWARLLEAAGFGRPPVFVLAQRDYFAALGQLLGSVAIEDWRVYLRFKLLKAYAPYLGDALLQEDFAFQGGVLRGIERLRPRWQRGVRLVSAELGDALGQRYVARYFSPRAREHIEMLVENLRAAYRTAIEGAAWMGPETRAAALRKLESVTGQLGYPRKWRDYTSLVVTADDLVGNVQRSRRFEHAYQVSKLERPVDRDEWHMVPQTVNAYYAPTLNTIVFPAAILQPPFFDPDVDDAINYGAIGAIIGHEFSHGFDDQGRKFDADGRLRDWWTAEDAHRYAIRVSPLVDQYARFQPLPDVAVNGELTLGENIADLAGLVVAYRAYRLSLGDRDPPMIRGFTGDQRFFIGYALAWRGTDREEFLREMLLGDPHPPNEYRTLGPLQQMPEFYAAFGVRPGDQMYLDPAERIQLW